MKYGTMRPNPEVNPLFLRAKKRDIMFYKKSDLNTIRDLEKQIRRLESDIKILIYLAEQSPDINSDFKELADILHMDL